MNSRAVPHIDDRAAPAVAPVSVVIPCFRCGKTIAETIASVWAQTLRPAEILLVDDCSEDGTVEALRRLAAEYPPDWIKVFALPANGGPSKARNVGWEHASQEYIAFLDADDTWAPAKLELQMPGLISDPHLALIAHRMEVRDRALAPPTSRPPVRTEIVNRRRLLFGNPFPTASVVLRRDLPFRFNERFRRVEDFLLWAQIAHSGYRCAKVNQVLAAWHKPTYGAGGLSEDLAAMHKAGREVGRELLSQGLVSRPEHYLGRTIGILRRSRRNLLLMLRRNRIGAKQ